MVEDVTMNFDPLGSFKKHWTRKGTIHIVFVNVPIVSVWFVRSDKTDSEPLYLGSAVHPSEAARLLSEGSFDRELDEAGLPSAKDLGIPGDLATWNDAVIPPDFFRGMPET